MIRFLTHAKPAPATHWIGFTLPWKRRMYDVDADAFVIKRPKVYLGFRLHVG